MYKILIDLVENLTDRKDDELDSERSYYFYDRQKFRSRYYHPKDSQYENSIEDLSTLVKQIELFGETILEDEWGDILNTDIDKSFLTEDLGKVDELRMWMGEVGIIFMRFVYDNLGQKEKINYLTEFRKLVMDLLNNRGENTEELSTQMDTLKTDLEKNIEGGISPNLVDGEIDNYIFDNTKLIDKYLQKIGFDKNSLDQFFGEVMNNQENKMTLIHFPKLTDEKPKKELMTRKDVLNLFSISKTTLWRWTMVENKLPFIKINRRKFYKSSDVDKLIENNYSSNLST